MAVEKDLDTVKRRPRSAEEGFNLDDLDPRSKERIMTEAKKQLMSEMREELEASAKKAVVGEMETRIIADFMKAKKARILAFLIDLISKCERYALFAVKEISEREALDDVAVKWPGTGLNKKQRMTMAGLIASLGYQLTCREDGSGGEFLKGAIDERGVVTEFKFVPAQVERRAAYEANPQDGIVPRKHE